MAVGTGQCHAAASDLHGLQSEGRQERRSPSSVKALSSTAAVLNIKSMMMEEMKSDMGGSAAVMGAMHAVARLKPGIRVIGVIGAVENAIGPVPTAVGYLHRL